MLIKNRIFKIFIVLVTVLLLISATFTYSARYSESDIGNSDQNLLSSLHQAKSNSSELPFYLVKEKQSIHDVAADLQCSVYDLLLYNRLTGYEPLAAGQRLMTSQRLFQIKNSQNLSKISNDLPKKVIVKSSNLYGNAPLMVDFTAMNVDLDKYLYIWDLGDNRYSFDERPQHLYTRSGEYRIRLILYNKNFQRMESNSVNLSVPKIDYKYAGPDYLSLDRVGDILNLQCRMVDKQGLPVEILPGAEIAQNPVLIRQITTNKFIAEAAGYSQITISQGENQYHFNLFVSPFPSRQSVDPEYNWYFTQFDTGMRGNCGPASNTMVIRWATGSQYSVEAVREEIGIPYVGGGVDYGNLQENLEQHNIKTERLPFDDPQLIFDKVDQGKIMILLFDTSYITPTRGNSTKDYTGRYYPDRTGHYIVIKGYTLDKKYLIVYDAIPGDWYKNELRYQDGVSMIGRNRYFLVKDIMRAIRIPEILVISRSDFI